jgi:hypothetical protein
MAIANQAPGAESGRAEHSVLSPVQIVGGANCLPLETGFGELAPARYSTAEWRLDGWVLHRRGGRMLDRDLAAQPETEVLERKSEQSRA